jgi:two-component sensor histidine kinase
VRNNLQLVSAILRQQIDSNESDPKQGLRSIAQRVMSLANVYDHLLGNGLRRNIDFDEFIRLLCASLSAFQSKHTFPGSLMINGGPGPMLLDLDTVTAMGLVIAEIISNAYIHAFPGRAGAIVVSLTDNGKGGVLTIKDNGIGFVEPRTSKRHGLGLIRRQMEQIGGAVSVILVYGTE